MKTGAIAPVFYTVMKNQISFLKQNGSS